MPTSRFEPSAIKNKVKREEVVRRKKKAKTQAKLQKRVALAKLEANDPAAKKVRIGSILFYESQRLILNLRNVWHITFQKPSIILENLTHPF